VDRDSGNSIPVLSRFESKPNRAEPAESEIQIIGQLVEIHLEPAAREQARLSGG
jgi:hypothetical protein